MTDKINIEKLRALTEAATAGDKADGELLSLLIEIDGGMEAKLLELARAKMITVKTSELIGPALDWAVAKCETPSGRDNADTFLRDYLIGFSTRYSSTWSQAGPIIDREDITVLRCDDTYGTDCEGFTTIDRIPVWAATVGQHSTTSSTEHQQHEAMFQIGATDVVYGPTPLVAAMRAYVALKLARTPWNVKWDVEIDVPEELL